MRLLLFLFAWLIVTNVYCQEKTYDQKIKEWEAARKAKEAYIKAKNDSIKKLSSAEVAKILDKKNYPNYDADLNWLKNADKIYSSYARSEPREVLRFISEMDSFNRHVIRIKRIYEDYWFTHEIKLYEKCDMEKAYDPNMSYLTDAVNDLDEKIAKDLLPNYTREPADYMKAIKGYLNNAREETDEFKRNYKGLPAKFPPWAYYKDRIPELIAKAELTLMLFAKKVGTTDVVYTQLAAEQKTVAEQMNKDALAAYAGVKPPTDIYKGADAASCKALIIQSIKTDYPEVKVLKVYLIGAKWEKDEGYNYSFGNSSASQTVRSESNLEAAVAIENRESSKTCYVFYGKITKDNTNGKKYVFFSIDHYKEQHIDEVFIEKVVKK